LTVTNGFKLLVWSETDCKKLIIRFYLQSTKMLHPFKRFRCSCIDREK